MSLITDALGLRQRRAGKKITRQEQLPPFRAPKPQRAIVGVLGGVLVLGGLAYWRGAEAYDWLERVVLGLPAREKNSPKAEPAAAEVPAEKPGAPTVAGPAEGGTGAAVPVEEKKAEAQGAPAGPAAESEKVAGGDEAKPGATGLLRSEDMASISVSLAPTKEEEEKIRKAKEEERMREVREYLRRAVIQGVSDDGEDSRVLMDGQLVGLGEKTPLLDLVLEKVAPGQILFRDADGKKYPKSY